MGNRAVITTEHKDLGVYVHWNGGRDSVEAFLKYCELKGYPSPENDCYGWARLCQVIGNFFGGGTSLGIGNYENLDTNNWDNGVYIIKKWKIIGREYNNKEEQYNYDLEDMLEQIDISQPKSEQLGDFLKAKEVLVSDLKVGDEVYIKLFDDRFEKHKVLGFGNDEIVNGLDVTGLPYVDLYANTKSNEGSENHQDYTSNPNNYIQSKTIRKVIINENSLNII